MLLCTCYVYSDSLMAQNSPEVNNDYCLKNNNLYVKNNKQLKTGTDDV